MKVLKAIGIFFATIFSIAFFGVLIGGAFLSISSSLISKDNISKVFHSVDINSVKIDATIDGIEQRVTVGEYVANHFEDSNVDQEILEKVLSVPEANEVLSNYIGEYVEYFLNQRVLPEINENDINKIVYSSNLEEVIGRSITTEERQELHNILIDASNEINEKTKEDLKDINNEYDNIIAFEGIDLARFVLSSLMIFELIICLLFLIVLIGLCSWSFYKPLIFVGIPTLIAGITLFIVGALPSALINILDYNGELVNYESLKDLLNQFFNRCFVTGLIMIFAAIILLVIYNIINKRVINKTTENKVIEEPKKYCIKCGIYVKEKYCPNCGHKVGDEIIEEKKITKKKPVKKIDKES